MRILQVVTVETLGSTKKKKDKKKDKEAGDKYVSCNQNTFVILLSFVQCPERWSGGNRGLSSRTRFASFESSFHVQVFSPKFTAWQNIFCRMIKTAASERDKTPTDWVLQTLASTDNNTLEFVCTIFALFQCLLLPSFYIILVDFFRRSAHHLLQLEQICWIAGCTARR